MTPREGAVTHDCAACGGRGAFWASKAGFRLLRCPACGSVYLDSPPPVASEYYHHYYDGVSAPAPIVARSLERLVREAERFRRTQCWIDVGFGAGALLDAAESLGWRCYGTEAAGPMRDYGRERGWIVDGDLDSPAFSAAGFDVASMIEVIEHLGSPNGLLHRVAELLRPGGLLILTTPNVRSLNRWLLRERWSVFEPPAHLTLWTRLALRHALRRAGFRILRIRSEGLNPAEVMAAWRTSPRSEGPAIHRVDSAVALNTALSSHSGGRLFKSVANSVLNFLDAGDTLKVWAVRNAR